MLSKDTGRKRVRELKQVRVDVYDEQISEGASILKNDVITNVENFVGEDRRLTSHELYALIAVFFRV